MFACTSEAAKPSHNATVNTITGGTRITVPRPHQFSLSQRAAAHSWGSPSVFYKTLSKIRGSRRVSLPPQGSSSRRCTGGLSLAGGLGRAGEGISSLNRGKVVAKASAVGIDASVDSHASDNTWRPGAWSRDSGQTEKLSSGWRAIAIMVYAASMLFALGLFGKSFPILRLCILTYSLWSFIEWGFHNWIMHAKPKSWGRKFLRGHNLLHLDHHKDTDRHMILKDGFNPDSVYFHTKVTLYTPVIGTLILSALITVVNAGIPCWWAAVSSAVLAVVHSILWNTLHADSHGLQESLHFTDGMPSVKSLPRDNMLTNWVIRNHSLHHVMNGVGNFNIVLPGFDHVLGTYHFAKDISEVPNASKTARQAELKGALQ
mmetsp:Transcript_38353/g.64431  ORF Transcript_38353/g.64431 Transcript_38353/m.64431 type:complete len:373 (+) Transcript_38353:158-1276(+)